MNRLELSAKIISLETLRHTPAGIPILRLRLLNVSEVTELNHLRRLNMEIRAVALGETANALSQAKLDQAFNFSGFLAPIKQGSDYLIFHIQNFNSDQTANSSYP